jgi:ParB-like chromosome segregation protein Spo0J
MVHSNYSISQDYASLVPPLSAEEYESLKQSINQNRLWVPIVVNSLGVILDGHHRFKACQELGIEPSMVTMNFLDELHEKMFVIDSNLQRRHLNDFQRTELALKSKSILEQIAKKNMSSGGKGVEIQTPLGRIDAQIGKRAGVGKDTVRKVEQIKKAVERDNLLTPSIINALERGEISISSAFETLKDARKQQYGLDYCIRKKKEREVEEKQQQKKEPQWVLDAHQAIESSNLLQSLMGKLMDQLTGNAHVKPDELEKGEIYRRKLAEKSKPHLLAMAKQIPDGHIDATKGILQTLHFLMDKYEQILSDEIMSRRSMSEITGV